MSSNFAARRKTLRSWYAALRAANGHRNWWPAQSPFEVTVGAILTQNTAWTNVEKALTNLRALNALNPLAMRELPEAGLAEAIRPSGYFRQKALKLKAWLIFLDAYGGISGTEADLQLICLAGEESGSLRKKLLKIKGIGPETADCILLYALDRPSFVVDAYTRRILSRHGVIPEDMNYEDLREFFMEALPEDPDLYSDFHAQLVRTGNLYCRKTRPSCGECPLAPFLEYEIA